jgi:hypothetical protein
MINFYSLVKSTKTINPNKAVHGIDVPFRMLIAAPSGAGKTNALMNLIHHMDKTFHEIIVCVKSADEPLYQLLDDRLDNVIIYENGEVPPIEQYSILDEKTKKLKRIDKLQRLIIFDDLILDKKANQIALQYYIKARKLGFSMVYIGQSFFQIPKMIRDNCQYFILGKNLLKRDLRMILSIFPTETSLSDFANLYNQLTIEPLSTVIIDIQKNTLRKNIVENIYKL